LRSSAGAAAAWGAVALGETPDEYVRITLLALKSQPGELGQIVGERLDIVHLAYELQFLLG
jgi:hypothetical protein